MIGVEWRPPSQAVTPISGDIRIAPHEIELEHHRQPAPDQQETADGHDRHLICNMTLPDGGVVASRVVTTKIIGLSLILLKMLDDAHMFILSRYSAETVPTYPAPHMTIRIHLSTCLTFEDRFLQCRSV